MRGNGLLFGMALTSVLLVGLSLTAAPSSADFIVESTAPGNQFVSGNLTLTNDKSGAGTLANVSNFIPGDTATRVVTVTNTGNIGFTLEAVASATANTLLWSDVTNGLQAAVYSCPSAVACATTSLYSGALKNMTAANFTATGTIAASGVAYFTFVFSLPNTADNTFRNLTQDFTIAFTATQLAGGAR